VRKKSNPIKWITVHPGFSLAALACQRISEQMSMNYRLSIASLLLAGAAALSGPSAAATVVVHHATGHPHAVSRPHIAIHPAIHPGFGRGPGHFPRAAFHPLHAAIIGHVGFAHFTPLQRAAWTHGRWYHRWWHGRYGWWWNAAGAWFWYTAPVYPYPTDVSDYYYEEPDNGEQEATWYYCYSPPGYYPYVPYCNGQWRPVPAAGSGYDQAGPDQGFPGPQYDDRQGPPPGYGQSPAPGYYDQGPPPGYSDQGPPPGYYDQGPPPGYDQGPPPNYDQGPSPGYDEQGFPPGEQGPSNTQQGPK
jgi:hypothetical protein